MELFQFYTMNLTGSLYKAQGMGGGNNLSKGCLFLLNLKVQYNQTSKFYKKEINILTLTQEYGFEKENQVIKMTDLL